MRPGCQAAKDNTQYTAAEVINTWLQAYGNLNGDGFGIGWFSQQQECKPQDPSPCVFTSVTPAW